MNYQFDTEHAEKYGVDEAIMIYNFAFWIFKNKANGKHQHEGKTWTYNSYKAFAKQFPFWSENQIRTRIDSLIEQEVLIKGNFSKNSYDRTTWYAFKDEETFVYGSQMELGENPNGSEQSNDSTISTDNKPYRKQSAREKSPDSTENRSTQKPSQKEQSSRPGKSLKKEENDGAPAARNIIEKVEAAENLEALIQIYREYRKSKNKWDSLYTLEAQRHKFKKMGMERIKAAMINSISEGWTKLIEPEDSKGEDEKSIMLPRDARRFKRKKKLAQLQNGGK